MGQAEASGAGVVERYRQRVSAGQFSEDPAQIAVAQELDRVRASLLKAATAKKGALGWLLSRKRGVVEPTRGLYIHGDVGRGKTMLMDMFFDSVAMHRKRRVHFNDFMANVHDRIQKERERIKAANAKSGDPVPPVARAIADEARLLCFDEFSVTDIADAMILSRLFSALFDEGVTLVATSNVAPDDLYRDGLNRALFLPFVSILKRHAAVVSLDSPTDYRRLKLDRMRVYITPLGPDADAAMDDAWETVRDERPETRTMVAVKGREIAVPRAAGSSARFSFSELCEAPLAARDYIALAERFDTLLIDRVPVMDDASRNAAKRFILLVDTCYDRGIRLILSADSAPEGLYRGRIGAESFEFARTASRLTEMQSAKWLKAAAWNQRRAAA
jgi:cell division protein ZapE